MLALKTPSGAVLSTASGAVLAVCKFGMKKITLEDCALCSGVKRAHRFTKLSTQAVLEPALTREGTRNGLHYP